MPVLLDLFCGAGGCSMGYRQAGWHVVGVDREPMPDYPFMHFVQADALEYVAEHGHKFDAIHASPPCQVHSVLSHLATPGKHVDLVPQTREALIATGKPYVIENVPGAPLIDPVILCGSMFGLQTSCGAQLRRHRLFETNWPLVLDMECRHGAESVSVTGTGNAVGGRQRTIMVVGDSPREDHAEREKYRPKIISVFGGKARDVQAEKRRYERTVTITITGHAAQHGPYDGKNTKTITITGATPQNHIRETFSIQEARRAMGIDWMPMSRLSQAIPPAYCKWIGERLMDYMKGVIYG